MGVPGRTAQAVRRVSGTNQKRKRCRAAGEARSGSNRGLARTTLEAKRTAAISDQIAASGGAAGITLSARSSTCAGWSVAQTQITPSATTKRISSRTKTTTGRRLLILFKLITPLEDTPSPDERVEVDVAAALNPSSRRLRICGHGTVKLAHGLVVVEAPLLDDREGRRWYAEGGETCLVLTDCGDLLEPVPTFGPSFYRVIAREVEFSEADRYALVHGFHHRRTTH